MTANPHVLGLVEGAWPPNGGLGLVAVPKIFECIVALGAEATLLVAGRIPSVNGCTSSPATTLEFSAFTKWAFSPSVIRAAAKAVCEADIVSLHSLYSFPVLLGYLLAKQRCKPYIVWPLGVLAPFQRQVGGGKKWLYDRLFARRILKDAAAIVYTAAAERAEAPSWLQNTQSLVIPHGLDIEDFATLPPKGAFRAEHLSGFEGPVVTYLGRLNAKKGLDVLVGAFTKLTARFNGNIRLAIVGPSDPPGFEHSLKVVLRRAGIEHLAVFTGPINAHTAKLQALVDADCFALPSIAENFCFAMFEAMACGVPVVVSNTINFAPKVASYGAGLTVNRDPESFANALEAVLRDPARQRSMGNGGHRLAEAYSWSNCGKRLDIAIRAILNHQPFPPEITNE